jgi:spore coat-associated protein N
MNRTDARRHARTLAGLSLALAATAVAVGSGADFTAESANPANTFSAGSLSIDNSKDAAAVLSATDMRPGAPPTTGTVDIANSGSIAGRFTLSRDRLSSSDGGSANPAPFADKVVLTVTDCGRFAGGSAPACGDSDDVVVYDHKSLSAFDSSVGLGSFSAGERHRYQFAAALDGSAGNEYQGDGASARFVWDAVQSS